MGELANRRAAREIWISRSQRNAWIATSLLAIAVAFAIGMGAGKRSSRIGERAPATTGTLAGVAEPGVVELLARAEVAAMGADALTFDQELRGERALSTPDPVEPPTGDARVDAPAHAPPLSAGSTASTWQVEILRTTQRSAVRQARLGLQRLGYSPQLVVNSLWGEQEFSLRAGAGSSRSEAKQVLAELKSSKAELGVDGPFELIAPPE